MSELDHKEGWVLRNWCFCSVVLEKTLESTLDCKEIKPVNSKGNKSWIFIGRTDAKAEAPILWPPDVEGRLIRKDPDAGKGWRQEENGTTVDEMLRWHHWLNGHESEQTLVDGEGQRSLACCNPLSHKESDITQRLNNKFAPTPVIMIKSLVHLFLLQERMYHQKRERERERENVSYYLVLHLEVESRSSQFFGFLLASIDLHLVCKRGLYTKISG